MSAEKVGIIAGVTGIVGLNLANRLLAEGWKVYGISRRKPSYLPSAIQHVAVDLTDPISCQNGIEKLKDATHVFVATWVNKGSESENCMVNELVMANLLDCLSDSVEHVVLVTGTKNYLGPFEHFAKIKQSDLNVPFKESLPRLPYPNFYYNQEDVLFDRSEKKGFKWSVVRPAVIIGFAPFNQMNLGTSLAVYASICKHLDIPFIFPGGIKGYDIFLDATDAEFLASHVLWVVKESKAANKAINAVNGDVFCWRQVWKSFAEYFGVKTEEPSDPIDMEKLMADKGPVWDDIVKKHNLQPFKLEELTAWWHVNVDVSRTLTWFSSTTKSRKLGFREYQDSEESFTKLFNYLRLNKYIPQI